MCRKKVKVDIYDIIDREKNNYGIINREKNKTVQKKLTPKFQFLNFLPQNTEYAGKTIVI